MSRQECGSNLRLTGPDKSGLGPDCSLERRPEGAQEIRGRLWVAARCWCQWRSAPRCWTDSRDWSSAPPSGCLRNRTRRSNYWQNQVDQLLTKSGGANADRKGEKIIITMNEHLLTKTGRGIIIGTRRSKYWQNQAEELSSELGGTTESIGAIILKDDF